MNKITEHFDFWRIANYYVAFLAALFTIWLLTFIVPNRAVNGTCINCIELNDIQESDVRVEMQSSNEEGGASNVPKNIKAVPMEWHETTEAVRKMQQDIEKDKQELKDARTADTRRPSAGD